jgi:hypothetical protein
MLPRPLAAAVVAAFAAMALFATGAAAHAQAPSPSPKDDDEVQKTPVDPYTGGDLTVLVAGGCVGYGPFAWADGKRTEDIDRVLGQGRVLWLETEHFRIGCNLRSAGLPAEPDPRNALLDECRALHKRLPKIQERPKRLDPWLRAHLYAERAEAIYREFEAMLGDHVDPRSTQLAPPGGKYLGLPDKFLLLLFQKKSDLARYLDRFCGVQGDRSYGHYFAQTFQMVFALSAEGLEVPDDAALHSHFVYGLVGSLVTGYRGFTYLLPPWITEGLAHCFSRRVDTTFINITIGDADGVAAKDQHEWERKVRARVQHAQTTVPLDTMLGWQKVDDMGYHGHLQAWSRVSFLMSVAPAKVGELLYRLKSRPPGTGAAELREVTVTALQEVFGLDAAAFDAQWRDWVLRTYTRK